MTKVGEHVRQLRARRRLTVRELAARSGISHSTISLIERDRTSPTIETLAALANALGTTLVALFQNNASSIPYSPFYTKEDSAEKESRMIISYRVAGINHPNRLIIMMYETYEVGSDTSGDFSHTSQEARFVIDGEIEVTVGSMTKVLGPGGAYYFDSILSHRFRNVGNKNAVIISAVTSHTY